MYIRRLPSDELYHHGIKGQRWGVRRYQNPDGSLTDAGKKRYAKEFSRELYDRGYSPENRYVKTEHANWANRGYVNALENTKIGSIIKDDPELNKLRNEAIKEKKNYEETIKDFEKDRDKWTKEALVKYYKKTGYKNLSDKELLDDYLWWWKNDDGDQGQVFAYYIAKTGKEKDYDRYVDAQKKYIDGIGKRASELFGDVEVKGYYGNKKKISHIVTKAIEDYDGIDEYERYDYTYFNENDFKKN